MKRWLLIFLLLASTASADSWLDSRGDYYVAARVKMGLTTASSGALSDTTGSLLFNEAASAILAWQGVVKRVTSIPLAFGQYMYGYDTTLNKISDVWAETGVTGGYVNPVKSMRYVPVSQWSEQTHEATFGQHDSTLKLPSFYDFTDSLILVYPTPSKNGTSDTLRILGWHRIGDIDTVTTPTVIPEKYRHAILSHMVWNQAKARQHPQEAAFKEELANALSRIGLKLTEGGSVVPKKN